MVMIFFKIFILKDEHWLVKSNLNMIDFTLNLGFYIYLGLGERLLLG